ncbi:MAG: esterase/lipase family protein, partial [Planctomycetota bacterium]
MKTRHLLPAAVLLLLAAPALAAPTLDRVDWKLKKGRVLKIQVEASLGGAGEVLLTGDVNGVPVAQSKRVRRGGFRKMRFRVKTRRLGLRRVDKALVFDLSVVAAEAEGEETRRDVRVVSPVPLVLLPGLGNEQSPSSMEAFVPALQLEAAGYDGEGKRPNLIVHGYDSLTTSLPALGKTLNRPVRRLLRKTPFTRVDIVGFSMGGLVARSYMAGRRGAGKVRKCLFLATPNEGTPLAY